MMTHYSHASYPGLSVGMIDGKPPTPQFWAAIGEIYDRLNSASMKEIGDGKVDQPAAQSATILHIRGPGPQFPNSR